MKSSTESNVPQVVSDFRDPRITEIIDVRTPKEFAVDHIPGRMVLVVIFFFEFLKLFFAVVSSPELKAHGEFIVYQSSRRP